MSTNSDAFKNAIEMAADKSKSELLSEGKIESMAFFAHADGTMKAVSLSLKDEYQREAVMRRIREKALAENIPTVIVLSEMDNEHGMLLSGVSPGMKGSAHYGAGFSSGADDCIRCKCNIQNKSCDSLYGVLYSHTDCVFLQLYC